MQLFKDTVFLDYGQFCIRPASGGSADLDAHFRGQQNGLCGVAFPNTACFMASHGSIELEIHLYEKEPPTREFAEEIVEASAKFLDPRLVLEVLEQDTIPLSGINKGIYRIRYSIFGFGKGDEQIECGDSSPVEHYWIDIWPAPYQSDKIVAVYNDAARYWHKAFKEESAD